VRGEGSGGIRRSAVVIGREVELDHLLRCATDVRGEASRCVFVVGEGGVGKTRLLHEVAAASRRMGLAVMEARASATTPVAFSLVAEALRSWLRAHDGGAVDPPFDAGLRLVLPEWPGGDGSGHAALSDAQLRLLALEGVVRVTRDIAAASGGAVVVFDDVHTADPDSIETIRYLAAAHVEHLLIAGALRSDESVLAEQVVRNLARDDGADLFELKPLGRREVGELLGALLDSEAPTDLVDDVLARTDGVPLFVEEVLESHLRSGCVAIDADGARWRGGAPVVSRTIRDMVEARLARLPAGQRDIVVAGAVLGTFEPTLLAAVAETPESDVGRATAAAIDAGLLETTAGTIDFRHAIVREIVLEGILPHTLVALHRGAAAALAANAVIDATTLEQCAGHLAAAAEIDGAASLLTDAARRRLSEHALLGAEALARRALDLAREPETRAAAADVLARILEVQGRWTDALALDAETIGRHGADEARRLRMARCAIESAQPEVARDAIHSAIAAGDDSPFVAVIAGRLAMTEGDPGAALTESARAILAADAIGAVDARCAALDLRARALDYQGRRDEARAVWTQQLEEATAAGLTDAKMRAVVQLSKLEVFEGTPPYRLYEARDLARDAGALVEQAWAEENLAIALVIQGDPAPGNAILDDAIARCRDLRLDQLPYLLAARAGGASYSGDDAEFVEALLTEAEALAPTADLTIHTLGIRSDLAAREGRYEDALRYADQATELLKTSPGGAPNDVACWRVFALAVVGRHDDAVVALEDARSVPDDIARWHGRPVILAAADALLRGDAAGIDAAFASATGNMPFDLACMRVLAAEVLGGEDATRWLREAFDIYEVHGASREAARVRSLLRAAGAPVPRRRRKTDGVPSALAERRVTTREAEVLRLLGDGLSNAAIAERLFLSVRTVETHVSSLLSKLQLESRGQLTALNATIDYAVAGPPSQ